MGIVSTKDRLGDIIGQGGFGTVYQDTSNPDYAIKIITKEYDCNTGENEFNIQEKVYECMKNLKKGVIDIKIPKPIEFNRIKDAEYKCSIIMEKIPPLYDNNRVQLAFSFPLEKSDFSKLKYGWLILTSLGNPRGVFFNIPELKKYLKFHNSEYITKYTVKEVLYSMGVAVGYMTKNCTDAKDVEYFLSKNDKNELVLYIADFGMSNLIGSDEYDLDHILFDVVLPDETTPCFNEFIKGIKSVADNSKIISLFYEK